MSQRSHGDFWKRKQFARSSDEDSDKDSDGNIDEGIDDDSDEDNSGDSDSSSDHFSYIQDQYTLYSGSEDGGSEVSDIAREDMAKKAAIIASNSRHWTVRYQLWSLNGSQPNMLDLTINLPEDDISHMLFVSLHLMEREKLRIPVSFSTDLLTLTVMRLVVCITNSNYQAQELDRMFISDAL